jgi:TolB-like protein/Tfp pilus assembly protein PilF
VTTKEFENDDTQPFAVPAVGTMVSHYRIIRKIGAGGMGDVYLAEDTMLDRQVALKFLPPHLSRDEDCRARFIREAQAAAKLDHPNIIQIFEVAEYRERPFFAMQLVEGQSLRELIKNRGLEPAEAIELALQIGEGLNKAHQMGIIHRDVKPANIVVDRDGRARLLDFGLAEIRSLERLTPTGSTLGTMGYMSPEQIEVKGTDHRSDLFSLGVVLYEMITGRPPFKGETEAAVMHSVLQDTPEPLSRYKSGVSEDVQRIVSKLLEKDPQLRYQSAADVISDLKRLDRRHAGPAVTRRTKRRLVLPIAAVIIAVLIIGFYAIPFRRPVKEEIPTIAVLPFKDLSAQQDQAYFCDGIAEDLIGALTRLENLRVLARTSSFSLGEEGEDQLRTSRKLGVKALLTGSVRRADDRLRITAQLVNVADGYQVWSGRYDRTAVDVFAIQDEISRAIVAALEVQLTGPRGAPLVGLRTASPEAYNTYLTGRYHLAQRTPEGFARALQNFNKAIGEDPHFALAYVGVADCYNLLGFYDVLPAEKTFPAAKTAARQALEIDPTLGEAYTSLAHAIEFYDWQWGLAESTFVRALQLNPGYASAHQCYAEFLSAMGRTEESRAEYEIARRLDPLSAAIGSNIAGSLFMAREYDRALEEYRAALQLDQNFAPTHFFLGYVKAFLGEYDDALAELGQAAHLTGDTTSTIAGAFGYVYALAGRTDEAVRLLGELEKRAVSEHISPCGMSLLCTALGRTDQAFAWLEQAYDARDPWMVTLNVNPLFDNLRPDPRFAELLKKMNLVE